MPSVHTSPPSARRLSRSRYAAALLGLVLLQACGTDAAPPPPALALDSLNTRAQTLREVIEKHGELERFANAITLTGLDEMLGDVGPFTVFAPTDDAFRRGAYALDSLFSEARADTLRQLLTFHLVRGRFRPERIRDSLRVSTVFEKPIMLRTTRADSLHLLVEQRRVMGSVETRNGILYLIDTVLLPPPPDTTSTAAPWAIRPPAR